MNELVVLSKSNHVAVITLNRPDALNSLNSDLCKRFLEILEEIERDDDLRVVIITGAGEKSFCAGIDLRERKNLSDEEVNDLRRFVIFPLYRRLEEMEKPLIGAINGLTKSLPQTICTHAKIECLITGLVEPIGNQHRVCIANARLRTAGEKISRYQVRQPAHLAFQQG